MTISKDFLNKIACPEHTDSALKLDTDNNRLICNSCGSFYKIMNINSQSVPVFLSDQDLTNWNPGYNDNNTSIINSISGKKKKYHSIDSGLTLDVGCGESARGDYNIDCYIPDNLPKNFILANIERLPIRKKTFDIVTSYYNIEHMISPSEFLLTITSVARKKIYVVTDNSDWIGDIVLRLLGSGRIFHKEHYYKWSEEYLVNLVHRIGFSHYLVKAENFSNSIPVSILSFFRFIPRVGVIFLRDLYLEIDLQGSTNDHKK
jgi:uncharacterized protein YbaR (Trm112 family)